MELAPDIQDQLNRDGPVTVETVTATARGTNIIFVRQLNRSAYGLPNREEVRAAFFDTAGNCRYNMIIN